jgi:KipI family sensor histidine kinase inhibitor
MAFSMGDFGAPNIVRFGEAALVLETGQVPSIAIQRALGRAAAALQTANGTIDAVAGIGNLTLFYDPVRIDAESARARLAGAWQGAQRGETASAGAPVEIPVRFGGEDGPDLEALASARGIDAETFVTRYLAGDYAVYVMGFAPGFAYIGGLDSSLHAARRTEPRARVPAGSVAIGGAFTAVYPLESPGGWNIIGRTERALFDPQRMPASLLELGARVRFVRL